MLGHCREKPVFRFDPISAQSVAFPRHSAQLQPAAPDRQSRLHPAPFAATV